MALLIAEYARMKNRSPLEGLEKNLNSAAQCVSAVWDFAVDGGAVSTISLNDRHGNPVVIPANSLIYNVIVHVQTAPVSTSNDGQMALQAEAANDLITAADPDAGTGNWTKLLGIPDSATASDWVVTTVDRQVKLLISVHPFTAGRIHFHIFYCLGGSL